MITLFCSVILGGVVSHQGTSLCDQQFTEHLNKCLGSFTSNLDLYTRTKISDPFLHKIFLHHVCSNYKKMLLCIHVVLTNCKAKSNTEMVQERLGHHWVLQINNMCHIQSNSSKTQDLTNRNTDKFNERNRSHYEKAKQEEISHDSVLLNKLKHSSDTEGEVITMFVFRSALKATKQEGSMPNSLNNADNSHSSNLLQLLISLCGTNTREEKSMNYKFLAVNENSSHKNGTVRHVSWQVVVLITLTNCIHLLISAKSSVF